MIDTRADQVELGLLGLRAATSYDALPESTRVDVKSRIVDTAAALLCGLNEPPCPQLRHFAQAVYPAGDVSIVGTPIRTQIETAAFVNATTARVAELNDTYHVPGKPGIHASDVIFPLLALAQAHRSSGRDVIASVALAYESCLRTFDAAPPILGFDATNFVALGVAAGAAALLGLDEQQARNCISIVVVSHNLLRRVRIGEASSWKAVASGQAGRAGLFAALLAANRIDGPVAPFDGPSGWREAVAGAGLDLAQLTPTPADRFRLSRSIIKPRAACGTTIPSILAAEAAHRKLADPREPIAGVLVETFRDAWAKNASGAQHWSPARREVADHSIPYVVAAALRDGTITPSQFDAAHLADPELRALTRLVEVVEEPSFTREYETAHQHRARVTVRLRSGTEVSAESGGESGDMADVTAASDVDAKFLSLTAGLLGECRAQRALERLRGLDSEAVAAAVLPELEVVTNISRRSTPAKIIPKQGSLSSGIRSSGGSPWKCRSIR
jgi:2-methylcitrate dehydratase